jgi:hypothetical protein
MLEIRDYKNAGPWLYNEPLADELMGIVEPPPPSPLLLFAQKKKAAKSVPVGQEMPFTKMDKSFMSRLTKLKDLPKIKINGRNFSPTTEIYRLRRTYGLGEAISYGSVCGIEEANLANDRIDLMLEIEYKRRGWKVASKPTLYENLKETRLAFKKPIPERISIGLKSRNKMRRVLHLFYGGRTFSWSGSYLIGDVPEQKAEFIALIRQINSEDNND